MYHKIDFNFMFKLFLCIILINAIHANAYTGVTVKVNKCCKDNEYLNEDLTCTKSDDELLWSPVIYSPTNGGFIAPGTLPDNWLVLKSTIPNCNSVKTDKSYELRFINSQMNGLPPSFVNFENGSLYLQDENKLVNNDLYCIEVNGAVVCDEKDSYNNGFSIKNIVKGKIHKCCGDNAVYSEIKKSCVYSNEENNNHYNWNLNDNFSIIGGFPICANNQFTINGKLDEIYSLNIDGSLLNSNGKVYNDSYCIEKIAENVEDKASIFTCANNYISHNTDLRFFLYPIGLSISITFLILTLLSTLLLPCTYHILHWKCQINYIICLLLADILLCITQLFTMFISSTFCVLIAISMHFLFLAAFFWLNTMCFNIWWTFRDIRPTSLDKTQENFRLRMYEVYAWGVPLLITGVGALMDTLPSEYKPNIMRPKFGENKCWFYGDAEMLPYFYAPIGILLFLNLTLFIATARELTCGLWKTEVVKSTNERATLGRVCLKLVIVMGITWVADILSWALGGPSYVWYFTDILNTLQGLLIFIVVGCQPQVIAALRRWWNDTDTTDNGMGGTSSTNAPSVLNESTNKPVETLC